MTFAGTSELFHGTGWLAGPALVVTAGHCVYDPQLGWCTSIKVTPGLSGTGANGHPFGFETSTRFSAAETWVSLGDRGTDIGGIHLDRPIGKDLGWLAFGGMLADVQAEQMVCSAGYSEFVGDYFLQTRSLGQSLGVVDGRLFYTLDTQPGASGAPVMPGKWKVNPKVVAIHAYDETQSTATIAQESNSGTWLGDELCSLIRKWNSISEPT